MQIECPHCTTVNDLGLTNTVACEKCKEALTGHLYRKPLISASMALMIGIGGYYGVDKYVLEETRYPLAVEYSLVDSCTNSDSRIFSRSGYQEKKQVCICALEKTSNDMSYSDYKNDQQRFLSEFKSNALSCIK
jgi:hypothetical protein